jgi:hypothetical protein
LCYNADVYLTDIRIFDTKPFEERIYKGRTYQNPTLSPSKLHCHYERLDTYEREVPTLQQRVERDNRDYDSLLRLSLLLPARI